MIVNDRNFTTDIIPSLNVHQINPASYDLRLGYNFKVGRPLLGWLGWMLGKEWLSWRNVEYTDKPVWLLPNRPVLATTLERVTIPKDKTALVLLKSTEARRTVDHNLAAWIDPGFNGQITLELYSHMPVQITPGQRIGQLVVFDLKEESYGYRGKYQNQRGATSAR